MTNFKALEGDTAIVIDNGVYRSCPLYTLNGYLFVKVGTGFTRINADGSTSKPRQQIHLLDCTVEIGLDKLGRPVTDEYKGKRREIQNRGRECGVCPV